MKILTAFTGFDGAGLGIEAAGGEVVAGIEIDPEIAAVARMNGRAVDVIDITQANPDNYQGIDGAHFSPPCTRASNANATAEENEDGLKESQLDIDLANAVIRFIERLQPKIVTVENVYGYRKFQSYKGGKKCEGILPALERLGYWVDMQHVNAADYGVPQTRRRMIVRALRGAMIPPLPEPEPWKGWYQAIEDLIPTLPESQFAPWQLERLPAELKQSYLCDMFNASRDFTVCEPDKPSFTVTSIMFRRPITVPTAFLVNTREMHHGDGITADSGDAPVYTIAATSEANRHKAFIVGQNANDTSGAPIYVEADEPCTTIRAGQNHTPRAWLSQGRVVKMTPRALARFQSFPDSYKLPGSAALACKGIGNAVPPLMMQKIWTQLLEAAHVRN